MTNPFKAYDVRGIYPEDVNEAFAEQLGKAVATFLKANTLTIGRDARVSSDSLFEALVKGITSTGTNVVTLGQVSTPQFYFSLYTSEDDGGIMITASHNSREYNGFKICGKKAEAIFQENGFVEMQELMKDSKFKTGQGSISERNILDEYKQFLKPFIQKKRKFKIIIDCGNGMGKKEVDILKELYSEWIHIDTLFEEMDGNFPNHECNPIIRDNMIHLEQVLRDQDYDFGIGFDGDADRVVFFTDSGRMVSPDIMTAVLGVYLAKEHDSVGFEVRSSQVVQEELKKNKIEPKMYRAGHSYIQTSMKKDDTLFAGEKSGHYFYKTTNFKECTALTIIHVLNLLTDQNTQLHAVVLPLITRYDSSNELNYYVHDPEAALKRIKEEFVRENNGIVEIDGISVYSLNYFFNVRKSNTEPLVRLNVEGKTKNHVVDVRRRIEELLRGI